MKKDIAVIGCVRDRSGREISSAPAVEGIQHDYPNTTDVDVVVTTRPRKATDVVVYGVLYGVLLWLAPRLEWSSQDERSACAS